MENEKLNLVEEAEKPYNIRHRCFYFSKEILKFESECNYRKIHYSIFDQLIRSGTSIGANVIEGSVGSSKKDFINFFHIALKSTNETKYWLCLIRDMFDVNKKQLEELIIEANELSKIIAWIVISAK